MYFLASIRKLPERVREAVKQLERTLRAADPERARAALVDVLSPSGICLMPDKTGKYLIAETEMEPPLSLAAGGVSEINGSGGTITAL